MIIRDGLLQGVCNFMTLYRLLNGVVEVYRTEQWWENLTEILLKLLKYVHTLLLYIET